MKIRRRTLMKSSPENVRRLAASLRVRHVEEMSHRQLCSFLHWLFTRREKRERGLTWNA